MKPVLIEENAEFELLSSVDFYEQRRAGLGLDFEAAVQAAVWLIRASPERYPMKKNETRRCVMQHFPFVIHYLDLPDCLWIVAFAHTSRDPGYWKSRLASRPGYSGF